MKKFAGALGLIFVALVLLLGVAITFTIGWRPFIGPHGRPLTNRTFPPTPARLARGKYIAEDVAGCMDCHSPHDWTKHEGMEGAGENFPIVGLPGQISAPNLTPDRDTGIGTWSDDQLARHSRRNRPGWTCVVSPSCRINIIAACRRKTLPR